MFVCVSTSAVRRMCFFNKRPFAAEKTSGHAVRLVFFFFSRELLGFLRLCGKDDGGPETSGLLRGGLTPLSL